MSTITRCDICKRKIKEDRGVSEISVRYYWSDDGGEYCVNCWLDEKNWGRIHKTPKKRD